MDVERRELTYARPLDRKLEEAGCTGRDELERSKKNPQETTHFSSAAETEMGMVSVRWWLKSRQNECEHI